MVSSSELEACAFLKACEVPGQDKSIPVLDLTPGLDLHHANFLGTSSLDEIVPTGRGSNISALYPMWLD